jgi:hypothetical protein
LLLRAVTAPVLSSQVLVAHLRSLSRPAGEDVGGSQDVSPGWPPVPGGGGSRRGGEA